MKFRKKPIVIEAIQYDGTMESFNEIHEFCGFMNIQPLKNKTLLIDTLEGPHRASVGDWIIKGINGETFGNNTLIVSYEEANKIEDKQYADVEELILLLEEGLESWDEAYRVITKILTIKQYKEMISLKEVADD